MENKQKLNVGKRRIVHKENGITLVSLAITIIILLILAGTTLKIMSDTGILDSMEAGASKFEVSEDIDIISEIRKEVSIKNVGEVPLDEFGNLLDERRFPSYEGIEEYNGRKINDDELIVGCPHGDHTYLVTGDGTEKLPYSIKDIPEITISEYYINLNSGEGESGETDVTFTTTITCKNGLKSITLPNGIEVSDLSESKIKNSDSNIKNVTIDKTLFGKVTKIEIEYNVTKNGDYTFKAKSQSGVRRKKTAVVDQVVPGRNNIKIDYEPKADTNGSVKITISTTNTDTNYYIEYAIYSTDGKLIKNWTTGTEYTTSVNCIVYARLRDSKGNKGSEAAGNVTNIDKLEPEITNVGITNRTINSFTIQATAKDAEATVDYGTSGIKAFEFYVNGSLYKTVETNSKQQTNSASCQVTGLRVGTSYSYYVVAVDNATNKSDRSDKEGTTNVTTLHQYNITYLGNGNTGGSTSSQIKTEGTSISLSSNGFTKTGYSFVRWNTKADGTGTNYSAGETYTGNSGLTLYAQWSINSYTLNINHYLENANNTQYTLYTTTTRTITYGSTITLANYKTSITNGTYSYGTNSSGTTVSTTTMGTGTTINLYYSRDTYKLTVSRGSYISSVSGTGTYKVGQSVSISATVQSATTAYSYSWSRWSGDTSYVSSASSIRTIVTMPAKNITLTANGTYTTRSYAVTCIDVVGSTSGTRLGTNTQKYYYNYGSTASGSTWGTSSPYAGYNYSSCTSETVYGDTTVYRIFEKITYTVTYYINGTKHTKIVPYGGSFNETVSSSAIGTSSTHTFDGGGLLNGGYVEVEAYDDITVTLPSPEFVGWSTSSGSNISNCPSDCSKSYQINRDITLYAVFKCYNLGSGVSISNGQSYTCPTSNGCFLHIMNTTVNIGEISSSGPGKAYGVTSVDRRYSVVRLNYAGQTYSIPSDKDEMSQYGGGKQYRYSGYAYSINSYYCTQK